MATAVVIAKTVWNSPGVAVMSWSATVSGFGNPLNAPHLTDKTVEVRGPTGGTSRVIWEGSNDAPTGIFYTIQSIQGVDLNYATEGLDLVAQNPLYIRPRFDTVTAGKTLVATIVARGDK